MGKGTGEMEGILQLAGGLLVGGIALYRMAKDDQGKSGDDDEDDSLKLLKQKSSQHLLYEKEIH